MGYVGLCHRKDSLIGNNNVGFKVLKIKSTPAHHRCGSPSHPPLLGLAGRTPSPASAIDWFQQSGELGYIAAGAGKKIFLLLL